jgi:hypothetical protein
MLRPSTSQTKKKVDETSQKWTWTYHNYTEDTFLKIRNFPDWIRWIGFGREVCPLTGTPHLQGFLYTWEPVRLSKFKLTFLKNRHMEIVRGNFDQNESYCNKDKQWEEYGERPQQGRRNDILGIKRRLDQGMLLGDLQEDEAFFATITRNERALSKYAERIRGKRMKLEGRKTPKVYLLMGDTGCGKTPTIKKRHGAENCYCVFDVKRNWFDHYSGEPVVIFEDIEHTCAPPIQTLKNITDGDATIYPIKGGGVHIKPTHVYITSNEDPAFWYPGEDRHYAAIEGRFDEKWEFKKEYGYGRYKVVYKNPFRTGHELPEQQEIVEDGQEESQQDVQSSSAEEVQSSNDQETSDAQVHERP